MRINVDLGIRSYPVVIEGSGPIGLHKLIPRRGISRILAVFDAQLFALHGRSIVRSLRQSKLPVTYIALPLSEQFKNRRTFDDLHDWLLAERISQSDLIVACGGGVTTDLVGYAAATVLRGVPWAAVPTTLIGMVDAAIGGKTGINHPTAKNAIGTFWQPIFVYTYIPFLKTLPPRELQAGVGELVKYAGLTGDPMLSDIARLVDSGVRSDAKVWKKLVIASARYKAGVVSADERDTCIRQHLNLGHTFAHGIEHSLGYGTLLHGEAVLVGLLGATLLSGQTISGAERKLQTFRSLVERAIIGIPRRKVDTKRVLEAMALDKKRSGDASRFVLLSRPGKAVVTEKIESRQVQMALKQALHYYERNGGRSGANPDR